MKHEDRKKLKREYRELWKLVEVAVNRVDPIGLLALGMPDDEYEAEITEVVVKVKSAESKEALGEAIYQIFVEWFEPHTAGPRNLYDEIANEIWGHVRGQ